MAVIFVVCFCLCLLGFWIFEIFQITTYNKDWKDFLSVSYGFAGVATNLAAGLVYGKPYTPFSSPVLVGVLLLFCVFSNRNGGNGVRSCVCLCYRLRWAFNTSGMGCVIVGQLNREYWTGSFIFLFVYVFFYLAFFFLFFLSIKPASIYYYLVRMRIR
jgi:hypothetical protein